MTVRRVRLSIAAVVAVATTMTGSLQVASVATQSPVGVPAVEEGGDAPAGADSVSEPGAGLEADERADAASAVAAAAELDQRVEDVSQRDATTQVFANPDGSWTAESAPGPVRAQDDAGSWEPIDTALVPVEGGFAPVNALGDLVVSDGGAGAFASLETKGRETEWGWPSRLPAPQVAGSTATFADAVDGGDLVVTATTTGFRYDVVLNERPSAAVEIPVPVTTEVGASIVEAEGTVEVLGPKGQGLVTSTAPVMYDASQLGSEGPVSELPVEMTLEEVSTTSSVVTLQPDPEFLSDPETVYPVTVDPTYSSYVSRDTYVGSGDPNSRYPGSEDLQVGSGNDDRFYRTYLQFGGLPWLDTEVSSATLLMRNFHALTCSGSAVRVNQVTESYDNVELRWKSQPSVTTTGEARSSRAFGASGCSAPEDMTWNLTAIAKRWATVEGSNHGLRVAAVNESARSGYREFRSSEYDTNQSAWPRLVVTYNRFPDVPQKLFFSPAAENAIERTSLTPRLSAIVSDVDGGQVRSKFDVYRGSSLVWSGFGAFVPNRFASAVTVPPGKLQDGITYTVRVSANDGAGSSDRGGTVTGYSTGSFIADQAVDANVYFETEIEFPDESSLTTNTGTQEVEAVPAADGTPGLAGSELRMRSMLFPDDPSELDAEPVVVPKTDVDKLEEGTVPTPLGFPDPPAGYVYTDYANTGSPEITPEVTSPDSGSPEDTDDGFRDGTTESATIDLPDYYGGMVAFASTPNGYRLYGTNAMAKGYHYRSSEVTGRLKRCRTDTGQCDQIGEVRASFRETLNGRTSTRWSIISQVRRINGPAYSTNTLYHCGVSLKRRSDKTCRTDDSTADSSGDEYFLARSQLGRTENSESYSFGSGHSGNRKFPMVKFTTWWPGYTGSTTEVRFRGWDIRRYGSVWKMSPVSGTGD